MKISEILEFSSNNNFNIEFTGNKNIETDGYCQLNNLKNNCLTWIKNIKTFDFDSIEDNMQLVFVCNKSNVPETYNYIFCDNPKEVFFSIIAHFYASNEYPPEIKKTAIVETENINETVYIGHNSYIGKDVKIGDNVIIKNNVSIEGRVEIDDGCIIHSGVVIGTDGFGYFKNKNGINTKVPHLGGVKIGKNVEIGANTCIDRGTMGDTEIGDDVKIDNMCHIAHNVKIGRNALLCAFSTLCGSVIIENNCYIAPGAIINSQLRAGENSVLGIGSVIINNVKKNKTVFGVPAKILTVEK